MNTFTYSAILILVFFLGIFLFSYLESPRKTFNKGIKKLKRIQIFKLNRTDKTLMVPAPGKRSSKNNSHGLGLYVHEY